MHSPASRPANLLGAASLAVADAVRGAAEDACGLGGAVPAALVTLDAYPGRSMEALRVALGISQPGVVRLVERMQQRGWIRRRPQGRAVALSLTPAGREAAQRLLAARDEALARMLEPLDAAERAQLEPLLEKLLAAHTSERRDLERLCRLCHREACPACPVDLALGG